MAHDGHAGRLELTWTNKDQRLLVDEDGSYQWVPPSDYRIAEVRLLHDAGTVGEVGGSRRRAQDNLLIRGDALNALTALAELPEFADEYLGKVKLAYLDPPFNTQQSFLQYDDALEHSVWLTMMRDRLLQIRQLLSPDGSVWVHLDDSEMAYCRALLDEIFGRENFVASVIWQKNFASKNTARHFSADHDYLLVFAKRANDWEPERLERTAEMDARYSNPDKDPRGPWTSGDLAARNYYSEGTYPVTAPSGRTITGPPKGSFWRVNQRRLAELAADNRIWWGPAGDGVPRIKRFLTEVRQGRVPQTIWLNSETGHTQEAKKEIKALFPELDPFATPKPERLLNRVVHIGSKPGDVVLDCFLGSGTTAAVAHKMGRRWVGVESSRDTLENFCMPRLQKIAAGEDAGGITKDVDWRGGGGFRVLDVGPSMFEEDEGRVILADWATNTALAEATAAQLSFEYAPEPPFAGSKGRTRLSVIDGIVNAAVVELLVTRLGEDERLAVCATSVDPEAGEVLRQLRPGSRIRKIPASILAEYHQTHRWQPSTAQAAASSDARPAADLQPAETPT